MEFVVFTFFSDTGLAEAKEAENTQHSRERHSSWIGRSLRRISSASKSTSEEPVDKTEKPKRERRRSLLRRLGRDSKSTEIVENVAQDAPNDVVVAKSHDAKEDKKVGKKEERKGEKREEKKEEKGITNYLRRSSRRKKSQVCKLFIFLLTTDIRVHEVTSHVGKRYIVEIVFCGVIQK